MTTMPVLMSRKTWRIGLRHREIADETISEISAVLKSIPRTVKIDQEAADKIRRLETLVSRYERRTDALYL